MARGRPESGSRHPRSSAEARFIGGPLAGESRRVSYPPPRHVYAPMPYMAPTWIPNAGVIGTSPTTRAMYVLWDDWPIRYRFERVTL